MEPLPWAVPATLFAAAPLQEMARWVVNTRIVKIDVDLPRDRPRRKSGSSNQQTKLGSLVDPFFFAADAILKRQVTMNYVETTTGEDLTLMQAMMGVGGHDMPTPAPLPLAAFSENGTAIMYDTALLDPSHPLRAIFTLVSHPPSRTLRLAALTGVAKTHIIPMGPEAVVFGERQDHFVEYRSLLNFVTHDEAHPGWEIVISTVDRYVYLRPTFRTLGSPSSKGGDLVLVTVDLGAQVVTASIPSLSPANPTPSPDLILPDNAYDWGQFAGDDPFAMFAGDQAPLMSSTSASNYPCNSPSSVFAEWVNSMTPAEVAQPPPLSDPEDQICLLPFSNESVSLTQLEDVLALPVLQPPVLQYDRLSHRKQKTRLRRQRHRQRLRQIRNAPGITQA
jgi:hypothetical protein